MMAGFMTHDDGFRLLLANATSARLRGMVVERVVETRDGTAGMFFPPMRGRGATIHYRSGRDALRTLFSLCHEIGHFWAYATKRRTKEYDSARLRYSVWENKVTLHMRNADAVQQYPPGAAPCQVLEEARQQAYRAHPCQLSEEEKREILAEENRAWCFGFHVASKLNVSSKDSFVAEAAAAMNAYADRLFATPVGWTESDCLVRLSEEDCSFLTALVAVQPIENGGRGG